MKTLTIIIVLISIFAVSAIADETAKKVKVDTLEPQFADLDSAQAMLLPFSISNLEHYMGIKPYHEDAEFVHYKLTIKDKGNRGSCIETIGIDKENQEWSISGSYYGENLPPTLGEFIYNSNFIHWQFKNTKHWTK